MSDFVFDAASPHQENKSPLPREWGFLGVSNPEAYAAALSMPSEDLGRHLQTFLDRQAIAVQGARLFAGQVKYESDEDRILLATIEQNIKQLDGGLCEAGGYLEGLLVRLRAAPRASPLESGPAHISTARLRLLTIADSELQDIADLLRRQIEERDQTGDIKDIARGMLLRIRELSEIMAECAGAYTEAASLSDLGRRMGLATITEDNHV